MLDGNRQALGADMIRWRHEIHQKPELGFAEHETAAMVARHLKTIGLTLHEGIGGTGIVGMLKAGTSSRAIGIRADMDALAIQEQNEFDHKSQIPGQMHACGHDGHTSILMGAAAMLAEEPCFDGTVYFIFQPAEEHGRGALSMMEDGLFERFPMDAIYALHNMPSLPTGHVAVKPGPVMASEDNFEITVLGKGGHAALPHLAKDPIPVAAEIALALQSIISRKLKPTDSAVISITDIQTDGTRNVIPNRVTLTGDTRSFDPEVQNTLEREMERTTANICSAHDVGFEFAYSREFASTISTEAEARHVFDAATALLGPEKIRWDGEPIMASEDFGFMLQQKPGCYFLLGNGGDGPGGCGLHSPHYDFNDDILMTGARLWVELVRQQLPVTA
ncbi:M20 aminoacylase family protein [Aestuariispira insulae]|uniref:Hippurate hydrolase n=1 Tax=Aestuariispira insulae TaxID=1461337 RepID=A0A3D9H9K2_9PROT|nr:M20 aminoacylase family protein [Aestuariispira insulae]RED46174.1 hippurate hydrolase [Aestuariispira insulae]